MTVLLLDHACHLKTKSFDFLKALLATRFEVLTFHYSEAYKFSIPNDLLARADVVVCCEFLASRFALGVPGKRCVYFPMYDNEWGSKGLWKRLALLGMNVVSFCRRLTMQAKACGVQNALDVRYAFDPARFVGMAGNARIASFWDRGDITEKEARGLFAENAIDEFVLKKGFLSDEAFAQFLSRPGVFVAPRRKEGIGMAFLEQMAMGKCVIGHQDATMDEYIEDGESGILTDMNHPRLVRASEIEHVRANMPKVAAEMYARWQEDEVRILDFFEDVMKRPPLQSPWSLRSLLWYGYYWIEGILMRLRER